MCGFPGRFLSPPLRPPSNKTFTPPPPRIRSRAHELLSAVETGDVPEGLLPEAAVEPLREVFAANSLLFAFALLRSLETPGADGRPARFADACFETARLFEA